ncbi:uncharacterized protein LOC6734504 isoform X4 [Drosophila simulans]|uniref:Uncharacterized protein, isoform D n=1 Tax=Drosophila simulans TaxID=7240 RepID=A0A0J9U220_DROSI|nr:uncharacterized protein LOC6734504 isoform X4 [Drosophila simulans]KMY93805.1 uncharacterized protein Dsimw501_GD25670, isoform D [Drosophila simulans]
MEDIEYLDEYKDLVLPGIKSSAPPASAGVPRQRRISSDSSSSSSIDADIFQKLFHGKYLDDELLKEGSGSKSQDRRRRPPSSSSSDESNDALEALFCGKSSQSKLSKRRERYESFDSVDDLGEALMRPSHRLTVPKPSTSQAGSKKSQDAIPHRSISNSSSGNIAMSSGHTFASPKNKKTNSVANKTAVSANGDKGTSSKNKTVTIVKPQKTDLRPSRLEPKTDPLTLGDLYGDSDSDSSYEYESDFYGDQDSDEEDEPVIDISTDTSRTTSVADTVTPVVSDDEGQEPQSELNQRPENDKESFLSSTYERLQSYLSNLSSAEAPPIYKKQNSARKSRSNEKKSSSFQQVKHANEQTAASDKEANKKERDLEPPEANSSAKSSASKASGSRKLYDVDSNATLEAVERMSLDLAEQILKIDVERSYEFEKRSGSKSRSLSRSKIPADSSTSQMDYVRKLTYSSERLDQPEPLSTQLRRSKSESLPKRGRPRGQKQRKIRAATTEEKSPNVRVGEGEPVKRRRGRPRKIIPKEEPTTAETANPIESLNTNVPLSIDTSKGNPETERVNLEVPTKQDEPISELDNAKELTGSTNLSKDDIKMASSHQETDQKCAPDRVALDKSESAPKVEQEPHCKVDTPTETFDTALDESKVSESATNHIESEDKGLSSDKEKTQKESRNGHSKKTNDNENSVICTNEVELPVDMAEAKAVSGNILEESDSQLAEDFKLAEEILAAEVGKAVEANEVPVTSVQGEQNPVIEIVKELEQETISEVVPAQNENQSSADEENPVENQSPVKEPSSSKDEPPAEEHSPGPDQDPVVKQETPVAKNKQHDKEHNEASQAESLSGSDDPSSSGTLSKKRNHSSPANTPKKSKEIEALQSSVPRRALRSDKATPQNQRESRSKRTLKTELTLLMDDTMRRSSPRLGRSPAESHSSQERSPMEKKVTVSKLAKDLITIEKEKVIELKSLPDAPETKDVKITKTTTASDTSILTDENPSSSKTEQKKLKGKALKAKKMRTSETEVKKAISDSNEDIPSSSSIKCVDEHLTSSESEPKDEKEEILCPKPPIDCTNTDLEQSTAIETDTEQVEEKRSNRRKSRRIRNEKFKTETDTHSDHSDVKKAEKVPLETQQSDPVTAKKERNSGRLSRKEKSVINADKSEKDESPSSKSQSTERTQLLNENPSKKDKKTEQSDNTNEAVPIGKTETSNSRNTIDKKSNKSSDSANHKESASIKLSSKSSPEKIMQDQDKKLDALNDGGDSDPTIRDTGEDSRQTDKEHEENNTKHEEEGAEPISKDSSQDSAKPRLSKTKSRNKEAAKRKQRQDVEKSLTGKKKPARRRQLAEVEERASHKRSKTELEAKSTVQGKFISIIGNETIMSSTTAPIRDTKSEAASTSPSARKPAVQESKHVETTKHIILGPPGKKLLHLDSPAAEVKKPMVQTLLSSTLSLQKPSTVDDGSPLKIRKSVKKSIADENIDGDQSILSSSSVLNKITSAVAPRKVNISVSLLQSKDTQVGTTASSSKTPILTKKEKLKTQKSTKKSEDNTKTESKKKSLVQGPQMKTQKSEEGLSGPKILNKSLKSETEFSKKTVSTVTGRKQIGQLEVSKKPESRKSEGSLLESNPRKKQSQVQRISKMDSRKSEGTSLTQPEVSKSETALKAALLKEAEFPVQVAEIEKMSKGRVHQNAVKNTKTEQPKSKTKTEVRSLDAEAAIDPMDSMNFQSDVSDIRAKFSEPQGIFNMPGHMPRAISSNRSLAPTPTPDRQRNASKERFTPVSDQKKPIRESQSLSKRRARGGKNQPLVSKRKAGEAEEDGTAVTNPKRPREMHEEDHPQQNDHVQEPAFAAFPVKITAASSVTHQVVHSTGNTVPLIVNSRKLCVKINRRPYNKWLRSTQERNIEQEGSRNVTSLPLLGETSETDSAGESTAESMLQSQVESEPVIQPLPASDPDSCPAQASDVQVRESSAQLAPIAANVSPAVNDSSTSPALDITPENAQTAKTTLKTGICSLTEQHLPDDPTLLDSSKNVAEPRKLQTFQAKCLPVPIPEVKSEPEDIMDEHSPNEPMPMVAAAPATPQPHAITEDPGPLTIQVNTLGVSTSSRPPELNSIPSASDPDGNPNTIGQTKMFSFLYPKRYKQSYDDVGLDFCCPNLDGPMRAIDFTRLHSKAEVPVLEVPQFLVITTKFISKADKNMPSKVRAKLELLGRSKERDSSKLTPTSTTPTGDPTGPSSFSPAPAPVGPATQPFPSIIQNLLSAPIPAPSPFNHPTTVDPSTSTPVVPGSSSSTTNSATLDSLSKQLPRGTTLTKKSVQQVATIPSLAGTSMVLNASPSFIQLPPICPNDKQRVELQARVQMFDLVLQTLSRRAANLSVAERQRTIEEIVRTSSLMAIDVDVGTKLLENYVHYLNKATSSMTPLTPAQINSSLGASTSSPLSKSIASSDTPQQGKKIPAAHVQQRSSLPATTMPLYDADRNTIGFPYSCSKSTAGRKSSYAANSTPVRASTSQAAAAALGKVQPRSTLGIPKSVREDASQFVNLNTTVCMPAPRTNAKKKPGTSGPLKSINSSPAVQKPSLCKQKTAPARTPAKSTARAKSTASLSAVLGETPADEFVSPAGMSLSTTGNPNVFIISHAGQQEESILPDSNSSVGHMETTEIKGELDDSAEIII